jgi:CYTH domain-containing protein
MSEAGRYARWELERRFLVERLPDGGDEQAGRLITDRYIIGTRLRLRRAEPLGEGETEYKLGQKEVPAPPDYWRMTITTIYLSADEYAVFSVLPAQKLRKRRYLLGPYSLDVFEGPLARLILAEVTFESEAELRAHPTPDFAVRDVSEDVRYTGGALAAKGLPA